MRKKQTWKKVVGLLMLPLLFLSMIPSFSFPSKAAGESLTVEN